MPLRQLMTAALAIGCLIILSGQAQVQAEMKLLLNAVYLKDGKATDHISLWGNDVDPNSSSVDDLYVLQLNGKKIDVPHDFLAALDYQRRDFSYDSQSGGIEAFQNKTQCMMAGPAVGIILQSRYLTYENYRIVAEEIKPVYSKPLNCIFNSHYRPQKTYAQISAAEALAKLQTIKAIFDR